MPVVKADTVQVGQVTFTVVWVVTDMTDSLGVGGAQIKKIAAYSGGGLTSAVAETFEAESDKNDRNLQEP